MNEHEQLDARIRRVHQFRQNLAAAKADLDGSRRRWEAENQALIDHVAALTQDVALAEGNLRLATVEVYKATGSKQPVPGMGVRITSRLSYSEVVAMAYGYEHKLFMRIDAKAFEAFARKQPEAVPFVTVEEVATATIATDLAPWLEEAD